MAGGKRVRVKLWGHQNRAVEMEAGATLGAVVGENLRWPNGSPVTVQSIQNLTNTGTTAAAVPNLWAKIVGIPAFIKSLAALTGVGLVSRITAGTAVARSIIGTTGRITIADGDADAGNPTINLGNFPTVQNGVYDGEIGTIPALHQMIVMDEFVFDDGILNIDGELVVL